MKSNNLLLPIIYIIFLLLLFPFMVAFGQPKHSFFLNTGFTFNPSVELDEQTVKNSNGYFFTIGGLKKIVTYKDNSLELGFALKTVFTSGQIGNASFNTATLRLAIPIRLVFPVGKKCWLATGMIIQNNEDLNTLDWRLRNKYDWRYDFFGEIKCFISKDWFLTTSGSINLTKIPDPFFINDPKVTFSIGIGKNVLIVNKRNNIRKARRKQKRKNKKNKL